MPPRPSSRVGSRSASQKLLGRRRQTRPRTSGETMGERDDLRPRGATGRGGSTASTGRTGAWMGIDDAVAHGRPVRDLDGLFEVVDANGETTQTGIFNRHSIAWSGSFNLLYRGVSGRRSLHFGIHRSVVPDPETLPTVRTGTGAVPVTRPPEFITFPCHDLGVERQSTMETNRHGLSCHRFFLR